MSRVEPKAIVPGESFVLEFPLRFTTYTFKAGHRIRLVITNAQFPMIWPTPYAMTTNLLVGDGTSYLELPLAPEGAPVEMPGPVVPDQERQDAETLDSQPLTAFRILRDEPEGLTEVQAEEGSRVRIADRVYEYKNVITYWVDNQTPSRAGFKGRGREDIQINGRTLQVLADVNIESTPTVFHVKVTRSLQENGGAIHQRTWEENIPRDFQ